VIVGGGALQDVVGYAAATARRGLRVVRVPTTVLSQANGAPGLRPPFAVVADLDLLGTLPPRDTIAGLAAALEVALVRDASFFDWLRANAPALRACEPAVVASAVRRAAEHHVDHTASASDPFECAPSLGHFATIANHELRHGEVAAIGCALAAVYSAACGMLEYEDLESILSTIEALGLPTYHPLLDSAVAGSELTLLDGIGHGVEANVFDPELLLRAVDSLRRRATPQ
jgi:3-dehydroquinate synthase